MKKAAFPLAALSILLAAALLSGVAARTVAAPPTGKTVSSGVLSVPSVLGLTADELTFSPWPMYDVDKRNPLPEEMQNGLCVFLFYTSQEESRQHTQKEMRDLGSDGALFLQTFLGNTVSDLRYADALDRLEWNLPASVTEVEHAPITSDLRFYCKDIPAQAALSGNPDVLLSVAASLSIAYSDMNAVTAIMRPVSQREITQEEQEAARAQVESDLRDFLLFHRTFGIDPYAIRVEISGDFFPDLPTEDGYGYSFQDAWISRYRDRSQMCPYLYDLLQSPIDLGAMDPLQSLFSAAVYGNFLVDLPEDPTLDEMLERLERLESWSVQIITTASQIVTLFNFPGTYTVGVVYDVQLGCYSGYGLVNHMIS